MRIFFAGNYWTNSGPGIVNRNIVNTLGEELMTHHSRSAWRIVLETFSLTLRADVIVLSGASNFDIFRIPLAKMFRKKLIYIMHGCVSLESEKNGYSNRIGIINEKFELKFADKLLCVSGLFKELMAERYPKYSHKMAVLTNGVDWNVYNDHSYTGSNNVVNPNLIVLIGGGRVTKRNLQVCQAVERVNCLYHKNLRVLVFGWPRENDDSKQIAEMDIVDFQQVIPQQDFYVKLKNCYLFVQNSEFEPFSLGLIDALMCGCNVLYSKYVGAKEIIGFSSMKDEIQDPMNIEELEDKIMHVLSYPNNNRLLNSINRETYSLSAAGKQLLDYCNQLFEKSS